MAGRAHVLLRRAPAGAGAGPSLRVDPAARLPDPSAPVSLARARASRAIIVVVPADKLTRKEVDFVLRRAAEIDTEAPAANERASDEALSVGDLVRLGEEAGLRRRLPWIRPSSRCGGACPSNPRRRARWRATLGAGRVVVSRVVAAPIDAVRRAVDRFLRDQLMTVRRHHGDRVEWERAQGIWPGLVRSLDFSKRYAFSLVTRVETILSPEGADGADTAVTFNIDVSDMRRERFTQMGLRAAMAFALLGLGGAAMVPGFGVYDIVALASGGVAAGGIFAIERRRYLESRSRVVLAPERFLDLLALRQKRRGTPDEEHGERNRRARPRQNDGVARPCVRRRASPPRNDLPAVCGHVVSGAALALGAVVRRRRQLVQGDVDGPVGAGIGREREIVISGQAVDIRRRVAFLERVLGELDLDRDDAQILVVLLA